MEILDGVAYTAKKKLLQPARVDGKKLRDDKYKPHERQNKHHDADNKNPEKYSFEFVYRALETIDLSFERFHL